MCVWQCYFLRITDKLLLFDLHLLSILILVRCFPVAQMVEQHGASNAKIMGSIPRESKS